MYLVAAQESCGWYTYQHIYKKIYMWLPLWKPSLMAHLVLWEIPIWSILIKTASCLQGYKIAGKSLMSIGSNVYVAS